MDRARACGASAGGPRSATALASAWWVVPLLVQSRYGVDFLRFTEQPGTIWATTSLTESLRLMGYWISYLGVGYGGRAAAVLRRRRRAAVRAAGGDRGAARARAGARRASRWTRARPLRAVRAGAGARRAARDGGGLPRGHAAAPGVELHLQPLRRRCSSCARPTRRGRWWRSALAVLGRAGARHAVPRRAWLLRPLPVSRARRRVLAARPRPGAWTTSCCGSGSRRPGRRRPTTSTRVPGTAARSCCPASSTRTTTGAGRSTRSCPRSPTRPVATRNAVPLRRPARDRPAVDGRRARPAAPRRARPARPLLDLLGARTVVAGADDDRDAQRRARPPPTPPTCSTSWARPTRRGARRGASPRAAGTLGDAARAAAGARLGPPDAPGLVRVEPDGAAVVVDGCAEGARRAGRVRARCRTGALAYAGDLAADELRRARARS